jgi:8-oxo-dGTP diphosphatase
MKVDEARPYIAAYGLLRKGNKVALLLRKNTGWKDGWYSLPAGKVDSGESNSMTAVRELLEEVGVSVQVNEVKAVLIMHRYERH